MELWVARAAESPEEWLVLVERERCHGRPLEE